MSRLERIWSNKGLPARLLLPLAGVYCAIAVLRRRCYRAGVAKSIRAGAPVVVVGNITVGGTGKTPLVLWIVNRLVSMGWRPGIVTRGYRGRARRWPQAVRPDSDPLQVGDEPVLLAHRSARPVVADPDRARGAAALVEQGCNVIVSDDGLQHYRLARDVELVVIDGTRRFGNGYCLPAGPLREPVSRLDTVHARIAHGTARAGEWSMSLQPRSFRRVRGGDEEAALDHFRGRTVIAVAGIGYPPRFFATLRGLGMRVKERPFPDHHRFALEDLTLNRSGEPIVMTEKDAVKCAALPIEDAWYLTVDAELDARFGDWFDQRLQELRRG